MNIADLEFRVLLKEDNAMFYNVYAVGKEKIYLISEAGLANFPTSKFEVMMYSGVKDIFDNKIFDGDILETFCFDKWWRHEVYFEDGVFRARGTDFLLTSGYFRGGTCRVIGNIFQHKHLLEK